MSVIQVSESLNKDNRSIYLINKINFVREQIQEKRIQLQFIRSSDNVADIGTKSFLQVDQHRRLALAAVVGL